ncbi:MAG: hypothetical protein H6867_06215 [Rhodospirillales bacterium]|nr:hypothetical protein [Rhodospirillales bacterium]MCB9995125.1 hypothetical protein [Rhodospirillales bacterium]
MSYRYERHTGEEKQKETRPSETWQRHCDRRQHQETSDTAGMKLIGFGSAAMAALTFANEGTRIMTPLIALPAVALGAMALKQALCPKVCQARNKLASYFKGQANPEAETETKTTIRHKIGSAIECGPVACVPA